MVFLQTYARWATNISLLLALILTVFLLSGTTSTTAGVRNLFIAKIELNSAGLESLTSSPTTSSAVGRLTPTSGSSKKPATSTLTVRSTISVPNATPKKRATFGRLTPAPSASSNKLPETGNAGDDTILIPRQLPVQGVTPEDEGSVVLVGYFGLCASNTTTNWSCTKTRNKAETLEDSPPKLLKLGENLQGAISPLPPIIAITLQGILIILSCFIGYRSPASLDTRLGKLFAVIAFAAFSASIFTAILFQSAASMIYSAFVTSDSIVASKGSGGITLAWTGVFFTGTAMAGVIVLLVLGDVPKKAKSHVKTTPWVSRFFSKGGEQERDIEITPVDQSSLQREKDSPVRYERRELHPQRGNFKAEALGKKVYSERIEDMRRGNSPFGNGWNMI